jgi:hypothetical protein
LATRWISSRVSADISGKFAKARDTVGTDFPTRSAMSFRVTGTPTSLVSGGKNWLVI